MQGPAWHGGRLLWFADENHRVLEPHHSKLWCAEFFGRLERHDVAAGKPPRR